MSDVVHDAGPPPAPQQRRRSARRSSAAGSIAGFSILTYAGLAVSFPTGPLTSRALGAASRGELAAVLSLTQILVLLLGLGVPVAVRRESALGDGPRRAALAGAARFCLWLPVPSIAVGALLAVTMLGDATGGARLGMVLMSAAVPVLVYRGCVYGAARGAGWLRPLGLMQALGLAAYTAGIVVAFVAGALSLGVALALSLVPYAADLLIGARATRLAWAAPRPPRVLLGFGSRAVLGQLAELSNLRLDQALMLSIAGAATAGRYAVAASIAGFNGVAGQAISSRWYRRLAEVPDARRADEAVRGARLASIASLAGAAAIALGSAVLLGPLYGAEFRSAYWPLVVLLAGTAPYAASAVISARLVVEDRPGRSTWGYLVGTVVTLVLLWPAVHVAGAMGAALVSTATQLATLVVLCRASGAPVRACLVPARDDAVALQRALARRAPRLAARTDGAWRAVRPSLGRGLLGVVVVVGSLVAGVLVVASPVLGVLAVGACVAAAAVLLLPLQVWALVALPLAVAIPGGVGLGTGGLFVSPLRAVVALGLARWALDRLDGAAAPPGGALGRGLAALLLAWCAWITATFVRHAGNGDSVADLLLFTLETAGPVFLVAAAVRTLADVRRAALVLAAVGVVEAGLGIAERVVGHHLLPDSLGLYAARLREGAVRSRGSLPHPIVLGAVCAMALFLLADVVLRRRRARGAAGLAWVGAAVLLGGLAASQSRGPALVLLIGALVCAVWLRGTHVSRGIGVVVAVGVLLLVSPLGSSARDTISASVGGGADRTDELSTSSSYRRVLVPVVARQVAHRPLGIGPGTPEGFRMVDRLDGRAFDFATTIDNAYGVTAVHYGVPGLVLQASLLVAVLVRAIRGGVALLRREGDTLGVALALALLAYVLLGFTVASFTFRQGNLMFWVLAGLAVALARLEHGRTVAPRSDEATIDLRDHVVLGAIGAR